MASSCGTANSLRSISPELCSLVPSRSALAATSSGSTGGLDGGFLINKGEDDERDDDKE
jgi:hypothetical protein